MSNWDPDMCEPIVRLVVTEKEVNSWDVLYSLLALLKVALHMLKHRNNKAFKTKNLFNIEPKYLEAKC